MTNRQAIDKEKLLERAFGKENFKDGILQLSPKDQLTRIANRKAGKSIGSQLPYTVRAERGLLTAEEIADLAVL